MDIFYAAVTLDIFIFVVDGIKRDLIYGKIMVSLLASDDIEFRCRCDAEMEWGSSVVLFLLVLGFSLGISKVTISYLLSLRKFYNLVIIITKAESTQLQ